MQVLMNMSQLDEIQIIPRVGEIVALPGIGTDGTPPSYEVHGHGATGSKKCRG